MTSPAPWSPQVAESLAVQLLTSLGFKESSRTLRLLRFGENAVFRAVDTGWVLRIARPSKSGSIVRTEVDYARALSDAGCAVTRPISDLEQPVAVGPTSASIWEWVPNDPGKRIGPYDFGRMLSDFHSCAAGVVVPLPEFDPLVNVAGRIRRSRGGVVPEEVLDLLQCWADECSTKLEGVESHLGIGNLHGDAHSGNVLVSCHGAVLTDFEHALRGPREWDLIPSLIALRRFDLGEEQYMEFVRGYGFDVREWEHCALLVRARELTMTTWLMQNASLEEEIADEVNTRIRSLANREDDTIWRAF